MKPVKIRTEEFWGKARAYGLEIAVYTVYRDGEYRRLISDTLSPRKDKSLGTKFVAVIAHGGTLYSTCADKLIAFSPRYNSNLCSVGKGVYGIYVDDLSSWDM